MHTYAQQHRKKKELGREWGEGELDIREGGTAGSMRKIVFSNGYFMMVHD